jgi:hypothetical protein
MLLAPRSASPEAVERRRFPLVASGEFLERQLVFCAETVLQALPKLICRVLRRRGVVSQRRGPSAKHAAMRARFRLHGWWQEWWTQTAMTEKTLAPMTTIDHVLRIDSARYPCGNGAAVYHGRAIAKRAYGSDVHLFCTELSDSGYYGAVLPDRTELSTSFWHNNTLLSLAVRSVAASQT